MDFVDRVAEYDSLPEQHRLDAYRKLLRETEFKLLGWPHNPKLDHIVMCPRHSRFGDPPRI